MKQKCCYIRFGGSRVLKDLQASCFISGAIKRAFSRTCMSRNSGGKRLISSVLTSNSAHSLFCSISHPDASEILPCFKHTSLPLECASCQKCGLAVPTIRACKGLSPSSLRRCHHSTFACAYALRAMPGAPQRMASAICADALFALMQSGLPSVRGNFTGIFR